MHQLYQFLFDTVFYGLHAVRCGIWRRSSGNRRTTTADRNKVCVHNPACNDLVVINRAQALLATDENVAAICGDLRDPQSILDNPKLRELIYLDRPVAIMLVAVLHFLEDASAYTAANYLKRVIPLGGFIVTSHVTADLVEAEIARTRHACSNSMPGRAATERPRLGYYRQAFSCL
jgi:hypothetical protein